MFPIRIGIICPSEIAIRRFMPSLAGLPEVYKYVGVAIASPKEWFGDCSSISQEIIKEQQERELAKAENFRQTYGGQIFSSYESIVGSQEIDALYLPLPPALHYKWAKIALEHGKHVMVEKPSTTCLDDTANLIELADKNDLGLHENYMFVFHDQIRAINSVIDDGQSIGVPYLYRLSFGFPRRASNDFRYNKALGGGALLDAGGYTLKYGSELLGNTARLVAAHASFCRDFDVDIFGTATMVNDNGIILQSAFGMDNDYRCDIEVWGSKGTLTSRRIFTAPAGFVPTYVLKQNQEYKEFSLPADDAFRKSLIHFSRCVYDKTVRNTYYSSIKLQASLLQRFKDLTGLS